MFLKAAGSALALALVVGCASNKATVGASPAAAPLTIATVAGDYTLVTVDGNALPYRPKSAAGVAARAIVAGSFIVKENGTFRLETSYAAESAPNAAATGTCYPEDGTMKMVWDGGGLTNMTQRGDTLFLNREGSQYGYLRRR